MAMADNDDELLRSRAEGAGDPDDEADDDEPENTHKDLPNVCGRRTRGLELSSLQGAQTVQSNRPSGAKKGNGPAKSPIGT